MRMHEALKDAGPEERRLGSRCVSIDRRDERDEERRAAAEAGGDDARRRGRGAP